jgi:HAD superfamily hydrolase (TIGR01459 family)
MRRVAGLSELAADYDGLLCDVWGVLHNGLRAFPHAVDAISRFRAAAGPVILITNAPRPCGSIQRQLRTLGVPDDAYDAIVTSGDVTRSVIAGRPGLPLFHLGPDRDLPFYEGLDVRFVGENEAELVSCTGLVNDDVETPEDYRPVLERLAERGLTMVCANPDIVVERGDRLLYCAGALAELYGELGGTAILAGKPHAPIYDAAKHRAAELGAGKLLAVGDGLATDIRGASANGIPAFFISGGIHAADFGSAATPDPSRIAARLDAEALAPVAFAPALTWDQDAA